MRKSLKSKHHMQFQWLFSGVKIENELALLNLALSLAHLALLVVMTSIVTNPS